MGPASAGDVEHCDGKQAEGNARNPFEVRGIDPLQHLRNDPETEQRDDEERARGDRRRFGADGSPRGIQQEADGGEQHEK